MMLMSLRRLLKRGLSAVETWELNLMVDSGLRLDSAFLIGVIGRGNNYSQN